MAPTVISIDVPTSAELLGQYFVNRHHGGFGYVCNPSADLLAAQLIESGVTPTFPAGYAAA